MNKKTITILGTSLSILFLVGLATTLTKSPMIGFLDILPVYLIMGLAIIMILVETFENLKNKLAVENKKYTVIFFFQFSLLFIQPIFMTSNLAIARGALGNIPPVTLACSRWLIVFLIFFPFVYQTIQKKKKIF